MGSLAKTYNQQKRFGQVYTPPFIVEKILDDLGYDSPLILQKTILDPACGDGRFLEEVVKRIISYSPIQDLVQNLSCVHGWDIDSEAVILCIKKLNQLIASHKITVNWNIRVVDAIQQLPNETLPDETLFDFIVGNPPYIRIQHLEEAQRQFIQQHYAFCQRGSTDLYIAFYELGLSLLKPNGMLGFITPNTFFYTETAKAMRHAMVQRACIKQITNYADIQVFDNVSTYSAIVILSKQPNTHFSFEQASSHTDFSKNQVAISQLNGQKVWRLSTTQQFDNEGIRLGDICNIHVGITTLCDKAYLFTAESLDDLYLLAKTRLAGEVRLEKGILKPIIKASKLKSGQETIKEYVLFPYQKVNGKHQIIPEKTLQEQFPLAYQYLLSVKAELDKRDNGAPNSVAWYAYGRSQGLETSFGKKILFSPMNKKPNFILSTNEEATFYSGYCIKFDGDYDALLKQLNSEKMDAFISVSSRDFRGGWKAYNKRVLEEFKIVM